MEVTARYEAFNGYVIFLRAGIRISVVQLQNF